MRHSSVHNVNMRTIATPFDILAYITDVLGAEWDKETLRALSQTCKFMALLCRRYIFSSISLSSAGEETDLIRLLHRSPDITRRIRKLKYFVEHKSTSEHILAILEVMRRSQPPFLQSITLTSFGWADWVEVNEPTKSLLISLIQLPTVTHLDLGLVHNFPFPALSLCSGLTDISVSQVSEATPHAYRTLPRAKIPAPASLHVAGFHSAILVLMQWHPLGRRSINGPAIDFSHLEKASFEISNVNEAFQMSLLLKTVTQLRTLSIEYEEPVELCGLGASLLENAYRTLNTIRLKLTVSADEHYDNPLCGLVSELRQLSGDNVLEELKVVVLVEADDTCDTSSRDWSDLDNVLTHQDAFPMLRRVAIDLKWYSHDRDEDEVEYLLNKLTRDKFPRLVASSTVRFKFHERHDYV
ncbi:hypothetical protein HYPSUDRAFT_49339 [Hypholoma sublateritium FD-334 SS-4]|uniref:F-box domain-containing protein n=1 Tax=Hypholoma sublateritium (strain FD-334 SS-4) TaxID=945553 RepID=A0A0D2N512_HYPSF|nr:hypothetical protein HYPSUDRAFT_49339 [Hypholoma sublateritium FD-334 SS-4]